MYTMNIDLMNKIVTVETTYVMLKDELVSALNKIEGILSQYGSKEVTILWLVDRLDPISQENLPLLINSLISQSDHILEIVTVHKKVVTRLQTQRIENEVNKTIECPLKVIRFDNRMKALEYLYGNDRVLYKMSNLS